eukprot:scaffold1522_cov174-Ochromonas_danica.AAC.11
MFQNWQGNMYKYSTTGSEKIKTCQQVLRQFCAGNQNGYSHPPPSQFPMSDVFMLAVVLPIDDDDTLA